MPTSMVNIITPYVDMTFVFPMKNSSDKYSFYIPKIIQAF